MTPSHGTILLADDEEKILKRLGRALRDEGHEVIEATTIREAQRHRNHTEAARQIHR